MLFDDQAAAQESIDHVALTFEACPVEQFDPNEVHHDVTTSGQGGAFLADVADSSLAVSSRSTYQQAPTLGLTEMRWVRIANAVIFTYDTGEAMSDDPGPGREATQRAVQMVTIWCETNGGC